MDGPPDAPGRVREGLLVSNTMRYWYTKTSHLHASTHKGSADYRAVICNCVGNTLCTFVRSTWSVAIALDNSSLHSCVHTLSDVVLACSANCPEANCPRQFHYSTRGTPRSRRRVTRDTIHQTTRQKETTRQARRLEQAS